MDIAIRNATVITMDSDRRIIEDDGVIVSDGQISEVGKSQNLSEEQAEQELDARGKIVMPGLINPHIHLSYALAPGSGDDLPYMEWLPIVLGLEDEYSEDDWHLSSLLSMVEAIKGGTTCVGDTTIYGAIDAVVRAVDECGIRAVVGKNITNITAEALAENPWLNRPKRQNGTCSIEAAIEDHRRWDGKLDDRLRIRFSSQIWPACSTERYKAIARLSHDNGIGTMIHDTEAKEWGEFVQHAYGKAPTFMLRDFGILGPQTLLQNASILIDDEIRLIAETNTCFNYLPTPNMKNYLGILDVTKALRSGSHYGFGHVRCSHQQCQSYVPGNEGSRPSAAGGKGGT